MALPFHRYLAMVCFLLLAPAGAQNTTSSLSRLSDPVVTVRMAAFDDMRDGGRIPGNDETRLALIQLLRRELDYSESPAAPVQDSVWAGYFRDVAFVVAGLADSRAIPVLARIINRGRVVTDALSSLAPASVDPVVAMLDSPDPTMVIGATYALSRMLDADNAGRVASPPVRTRIIQALTRTAGAAAANRFAAEAASAALAKTQPAGLRFVPLAPCRLLDTRPQYAGTTWTGSFGPPRWNAGQTRTLPVAGAARCGVPSTARAFMFNITADTVEESTGPVDLVTVFPTGSPRPPFGTIRTTTGGYIANAAIVASGTSGSVDIYASHAVHLLVDVSGYFTADLAAPGLLFYPFGPCRAVDTRGSLYSQLPPPYGNSRLAARQTRSFRLPNSPGCPGLPVAPAYSLQMTLAPGNETNGSPVAYLTAWPGGSQTAQPVISNMNSYFGYAVANSGIVPSSSDGTINLYAFDATNVILDVNGYFAPDDGSGRGLLYYPVEQCRAANTQDSTLGGSYGPGPLTPLVDREISIANSPRCPGLSATARAWSLNVTAVPNGLSLPFLSLWPASAPWPVVSQLNAFQGQTVSNSGIVPAGPGGAIQMKVNASTHALIEVSGYFSR